MANDVDWRGTARYFAREHDIGGETVDDLCDLVVGIATAEASVARDTIARLTRERDEALEDLAYQEECVREAHGVTARARELHAAAEAEVERLRALVVEVAGLREDAARLRAHFKRFRESEIGKYDAERASLTRERDEALAERDEARCRIELAVDEMDRLRGVEQRTLDELRAEVEERDEARSQLALAMEWGRQLADHHDEHATRSEREERAELERDHARAERDDLLDEVGQYRGIVEDVASRPCEVEGCGITTAACLPCRARHWLERG